MPLFFSGLFLAKSISNYVLQCNVSDENGVEQSVPLNYYFPSNTERPFPQAFQKVVPNEVYFISGTFAILDNNVVSVYPLS
jgi:hypothetical protein